MKAITKCANSIKYLGDGVMISGHNFEQVVAFQDVETNRWYYVLRCTECKHPSVAFSNTDTESEQYDSVLRVGARK